MGTEPGSFAPPPTGKVYPTFGTAPIRCGRLRCKWRGFECQLVDSEKRNGMTFKLCPLCFCDSYSFMTPGEVRAWEWSKAK